MTHTLHLVTTWASALIALATALAYFARPKAVLANFASLGYPGYLPWILGVWKLLGSIALVAPAPPELREWAYAGFFFNYSGAAVSHLFCREWARIAPPLVVLALLIASYATR